MYKLRPLELSLLFGVLVALLWGSGTVHAQEELSDSLIRLHVIANSDDEIDQDHKLAVRDAILSMVDDWGERARTIQEMETLLCENLNELERAGEEVLRRRGCAHEVRATLTNCYFPTKEYAGFALPAGEYRALRIEIGAGDGANWWCVAFPPLCVGAGMKEVEEAVQAGFFTEKQAQFLAGEADHYVLKFRSLELLGQLKGLICRG